MYDHDFCSWLADRADRRHCRDLLRGGSHSFFAASLLLPGRFRAPMTALYAFCRLADDAVDDAGARADAVDRLHGRLDAVYAGRPADCPVERAFADAVERFGIPQALPAAMFEGFAWDLRSRRYATLSEVYAYAARVAGTVGTMMAVVMGVRRPDVLSRACDLGIAMQLTNIARDVGEDARNGRLYLPADRLAAHGVDADAWLAQPAFGPGVGAVVGELLVAAERLYRRSEWGIAQLPRGCRQAMFAARLIYADIGRVVASRGHDSVNGRAVVGGRRKLALLAQALRHTLIEPEAVASPTLDEARFLIDAVVRV